MNFRLIGIAPILDKYLLLYFSDCQESSYTEAYNV